MLARHTRFADLCRAPVAAAKPMPKAAAAPRATVMPQQKAKPVASRFAHLADAGDTIRAALAARTEAPPPKGSAVVRRIVRNYRAAAGGFRVG